MAVTAAPDESVAQGGERPFQLGPAHEDATEVAHAAVRSWIDR
jgi:hypothetical protein